MKTSAEKIFSSPLWKDKALAAAALERIAALAARVAPARGGRVNFMEVCGSHTMAIAASGMRKLFPKELRMLSGPGCPVCVTSQGDIDRLLDLAAVKGLAVCTFGDMLKVKGSSGLDLQAMRERGADVRVVYSPLDAVEAAAAEPARNFVFIGVGFETTAPVIAGALLEARRRGLKNFFITSLFKLVPPALELLLSDPSAEIAGFLLPGHVSAIIGPEPYAFVADRYRTPCVIAGFEPMDILRGINQLLEQLAEGKAEVQSEYSRVVRPGGNHRAQEILKEVFRPADADWRAIGIIRASGFALSRDFASYDAFVKFKIGERRSPEPKGCLCGAILMGRALPKDCKMFGKACTPGNAVGPCMVSSEGACAAWFKYGE